MEVSEVQCERSSLMLLSRGRGTAVGGVASGAATHLGRHASDSSGFILECVDMCLRAYFPILHICNFIIINTRVGVPTHLNCANYYCYF